MAATKLGIPAPAQVNKRPSGRYAIKAPDAPVGSILRVTTKDRSTRFVEVAAPHGRRLFVDLDGTEIGFCDWDFATRVEVETFRFEKQIARCADDVELRGAPAFAASLRAAGSERDTILRAVADELRMRGKKGKAEQVLVFQWSES
jgi:hypothetical protein